MGFSPGPSGEGPKEIEIDYARERTARSLAERPSISQPAAGGLPQELVPELPDASQTREEHGEKGALRGAAAGLETRAAVAATWTARQQLTVFGRREIYRAGFFDGLQQAFHDPLIGDWDFGQGHLAGRRDQRAHRSSNELGAAGAFPGITAASRLESPKRAMVPTYPMPVVQGPRLLDVFEDLPLSSVLKAAEIEPLPDPFKLYRCVSYDDFYDRRWTEPEHAFDYWVNHHQDGAFWRQLSSGEKARFAEIFRSAYRRQLIGLLAGVGEGSYARGHGDGWSYGVTVVQEWSYRQGFHQGFTSAIREHARSAFHDVEACLFVDRYGKQAMLRPRGPQ